MHSDPAIIPQSRIGFPKRGHCTPYLLTVWDSQCCMLHCFCRLPACLLPYCAVNKQTEADRLQTDCNLKASKEFARI